MKTLSLTFKKDSVKLDNMGVDIAELFVISKMCKTKSEVRRAILQGAIAINDVKVKNPFARIVIDFNDNVTYILSEDKN